MVTKHTLREILARLQVIGTERPEDQSIIMDVLNIITHHVKIVDQLKKVSKEQIPEKQVIEVSSVQDVLFSE